MDVTFLHFLFPFLSVLGHRLQHKLRKHTKPDSYSPLLSVVINLTHTKMELMLENVLFREQLVVLRVKPETVFDGTVATISLRKGDNWQKVVDGDLVSRIDFLLGYLESLAQGLENLLPTHMDAQSDQGDTRRVSDMPFLRGGILLRIGRLRIGGWMTHASFSPCLIERDFARKRG